MPNASGLVVQNSVGATPVLMIKGAAILTSVKALNTTAAVAYVQVFNAAAVGDVTVGTTIPDWAVRSEASDPSLRDGIPDGGLSFGKGIVVASTTTLLGSTGATQHVRIGLI